MFAENNCSDDCPYFSLLSFPKQNASFLLLYRVRFHYGHPDVFDRLFHLTRGGICKASKVINLSEDIFAGIFYSCGGLSVSFIDS